MGAKVVLDNVCTARAFSVATVVGTTGTLVVLSIEGKLLTR